MPPRLFVLLVPVLLPLTAAAEVVCALAPSTASYNASQDQRPSPDAMQLAKGVNAVLSPICTPNCPVIAVFRNPTAPNAMLVASNGDAKIVYQPQFFSMVYDNYGDGAIIAIIAHELGHALNETAPAAWMNGGWSPELRADAWAGCALAKSSLSATSVKEALTAVAKYPSPAHPGWAQRLPALRLGFTHCGGDASKFGP
ncbi:MAG TPA: hypothetical protein VG096_19320 [Bryobacteraceae bacterium]|jgi:hypothetical protein|nr:hypothetical protein [Bryobacteraceae bacterium]